MRRLLLWGPPILYMAFIFHLSSESDPLPVLTQNIWDKVLHTTEYAGLAFLVARAFLGERVRILPAILLAVLLTSAYGASDEYHQSFVPLRDSDVHDWIADTLGGSVGAIAYAGLFGFQFRRSITKAE